MASVSSDGLTVLSGFSSFRCATLPVKILPMMNRTNGWTNFAKTGNPNAENLPEWPELKTGLIMDLGNEIKARENFRLGRYEFLGSFRNEGVYPLRWRKDVK